MTTDDKRPGATSQEAAEESALATADQPTDAVAGQPPGTGPAATPLWGPQQLALLSRLRQELDPKGRLIEAIQPTNPEGSEPWLTITLMDGVHLRSTRLALIRDIIGAGARQGLLLLPLVYSAQEWQARQSPPLGSTKPTAKKGQDRRPLFSYYGEHDPDGRALPAILRETVRAGQESLRGTLAVPSGPVRHRLALATAVVRELWELLFAAHDRRFEGSAQDLRFAQKHVVGHPPFELDDLVTYFQLLALCRQVEDAHQWAPGSWSDELEWTELHRRAQQVCDHFDLWILATYGSRRARTMRRVVKALGRGAALCLAMALLVMHCWTPELEPMSDQDFAHRRGGIKATYYHGRSFERQVLERVEPRISFNARGGSPAPGVRRDNFSVRWEGYLHSHWAGRRSLCLHGDNGFRLYLAGELLIDDWRDVRGRKQCTKVDLKKGWYPLKVEFFEGRGGAFFHLLTQDFLMEPQKVDTLQLCCGNDPALVAKSKVPQRPLPGSPQEEPETPSATKQGGSDQ